MSKLRTMFGRLRPRSLLTRMLLLTLLAVVIAQGISTAFWYTTFRAQENEGLLNSSRNLAYSAAATVRFFKSLPLEYRHIVLDQLRNMGGTRFFVSLNQQEISLKALPDTDRKMRVVDAVQGVLRERLGGSFPIRVEFVAPENVRILNSQMKLSDLPPSWANYALNLDPINPPVLVTQIEIAPDEWLYLAAPLPAPYVSLEDTGLPKQQILSTVLLTIFLLNFIALLVRWQTRPLRRLASAAREMPFDDERPPLAEQGSSEVVDVTRAFNTLRERIQRYLKDREQLFTSVSHDLKTPITRLRLRSELLDDELLRTKFEKDLQELDLLVKSALQSVKDNDIYENMESVDVHALIDQVTEPAAKTPGKVTLVGKALRPYRCKPLALRRCIGNLFDNALKYGERVTIRIEDSPETLALHFEDEGPGLAPRELTRIFEPYYRASPSTPGDGLGLGIARTIAHAHGGDVEASNRAERGLRLSLILPRNPR
ncbi:HAMP domain-containing protein [Marinobacter nanhaiticus D15-8W]|uniref:histidine kinase n=1 Tax=Marinobacter nanhaiticus D15-8W TaxID=626887 RepID=N6W337_9GAMM|nr:ATP-binding protein [Marinobacter nanhaiticus]ENO16960.2 HAMP domain-containing protein [Marinobacter nanhaiticus D15-8W]